MTLPPPGLAPPRRWPQILRNSAAVGVVLAVPALAAWLLGRPFIFPSLGPSAYFLVATHPQAHRWQHVLGGHALGAASGYVCYHLLAAHGALMTAHPAPLSMQALRLIGSGLAAVVLTTALMRLLHVVHPPACSTALIVGFGLLPTAGDALCIAAAVAVMTLSYRLLLQRGAG